MAAEATKRGWARTRLWLLYLVWFYPCWWGGRAVVNLVPELLRESAVGGPPARVWVSPFGFSGRAGVSLELLPWIALAAGSAWLACLTILGRVPAMRAVAILAAAWIADAALGRGVFAVLFRGEAGAAPLGLAAAGFAALVFSLRRLPAAAERPLWRAVELAGVLLAPLAAVQLTLLLLFDDFRLFGFGFTVAAIAAAIGAAVWIAPRQPAPPAGSMAPGLALGLVACCLVFFGAQQAGRALDEQAEAARRASLAPVPDPAPLPPAGPGFYYKGVNFTSEGPEPYGSKSAAAVLAELPRFGVNAVALVPYASQRADDPELRFPLRMERDELILATARMAHAEGLRVLLKPQIWVRGGGQYPGDLRYDDPAERARWFASYARLVEHYAKLATRADADMFCVGVEFAQLTPYEREWREIISLAQEHYDGPLVYAANFGTEFESIQFWDALDYIGLDNYYPLPENRSTDEIARKIEGVHRRFAKPVLFTEAGFSTYEFSHRKPWEDRPGGALSPEAQARNVEALLHGFQGRPWLRGIFWWKVGTAGRGGESDGSHILWNKPAMNVIGKWFRLSPEPKVTTE
jgi:sugar phosphate isomerase/epimerase